MMEKKEFTCIVCPIGCHITAEIENGKVISVSGNSCPRGDKYVRSEIVRPMRMLTTTMRTEEGRIIPVRTNIAVEKKKLFDCMREINSHTAPDDIKIGEVIIKNILETGADIIATGDPA